MKYIVDKLSKDVPSNPAPTTGASRNIDKTPDNPFAEMDKQGIKQNWNNILTQYTDKHNVKKINLK